MPASSDHSPPAFSRRQFLVTVGALWLGAALGIHSTPAAAFDPQRLRQSMQQQYGQAGLAILEEWFALLQQLQNPAATKH